MYKYHIFEHKKFQAPNNKLQIISKFKAPMIQTGFDLPRAFDLSSGRMQLVSKVGRM